MESKDESQPHGPLGPKQQGVSAGGSQLLKYSGGEFGHSTIGFTEESTLDLVEKREKIYRELFGESDTVLHEMIPFVPHVDVYQFPPNSNRGFFTYVTGGMSDLPMTAPEHLGADARRIELVFYAAEDQKEYAELLRRLAHFPHDNRTWLHWDHTMPNGHPPEPIFDTKVLDTFFFMPSIVQPDSELGRRLVWQGDPINLVWCVPISSRECSLKLKRGSDALYDLFDANQHPFVFRGCRASYA
jgi:hypothetical protein